MFTWYNLFKFLHVSAVIVWMGALVTMAVLNARMRRAGAGEALRLLSTQNLFLGRAVVGPSTGLALVAGLVLAWLRGEGFTYWMAWGLTAILASGALSGTLLRRSSEELVVLAGTPSGDDGSRLAAVRRRVTLGGLLNILILLSTVWAMISKPTL